MTNEELQVLRQIEEIISNRPAYVRLAAWLCKVSHRMSSILGRRQV